MVSVADSAIRRNLLLYAGSERDRKTGAENAMEELERLEFIVKEGPVVIQNQGSAKIDACYPVWDGISAKEFFPAGAERGAFYVVTLMKGVSDAKQMRAAEIELSKALFKIASAWVFSGGSHMEIETRELIVSPRVNSNVDTVFKRLVGRDGSTPISSTSAMAIESLATYSQAPLGFATDIARLMQNDFLVSRLISYYHQAWTERGTPSWALALYKVRDLLQTEYAGEARARRALGIPQKQWKQFGRLLNDNDLRHAEIRNVAPSISRQEVEWLYKTVRSWVAKFLSTMGVAAIG